MCSRASSPRFWPRGSIRSPRRRRPRRRTGSQRQRCRIRQVSSRATLSRSSRRCSADRPRRRPVGSLDSVRVEILGSGGAATIPRPGCRCRVCVEAREIGGRSVRTGPSTFVHGPNIVFDTPEESKFQLERAGIGEIAACFYSHWHPDHTMGKRVWETRNGDFRTWPREAKQPLVTDIYLPQQVASRLPQLARQHGAPRVHARARLGPDPRARGRRDAWTSVASRCGRSGSPRTTSTPSS